MREHEQEFRAKGARLAVGLAAAAKAADREVAIARVGSLLTVFFRGAVPRDAAEALTADRDAYARFFGAMLDEGVLLPPSPFEAWFLSGAHTERDVEKTIKAARAAMDDVAHAA